MAYKGLIKESRTYDALALMGVMTAIQPLLMDTLSSFEMSPKLSSLTNLFFIAYLAYLRSKTTGPVGDKK